MTSKNSLSSLNESENIQYIGEKVIMIEIKIIIKLKYECNLCKISYLCKFWISLTNFRNIMET